MAEEKQLWRCRLCGNEQPVGENNNICTVKSCGADLTLYGDIVKPPASIPHRFNWKPLVVVLAVLVAAAGIGFGGWSLGRVFGNPTGAEPPISAPPLDADTPEADQPGTSPEETSPPEAPPEPDKTELPDFGAFSNGWAHELADKAQTGGDVYSKSYEYTGAAGDVMIPEYIDLLTGSEDFKFVLADTKTLSDDTVSCTYYMLAYTGNAEVTEIIFEDSLGGQKIRAGDNAELNLVLSDRRSTEGGGKLEITCANELIPAVSAEKTSYNFNGAFTLQDFAAFSGSLLEETRSSERNAYFRYDYLLFSDEAMEAAEQYIDLIRSCAYPYYLNQSGDHLDGEYTIDFCGFEEFGPTRRLVYYPIYDSEDNKYAESLAVYIAIDRHSNGRTNWLTMYIAKDISLVDDGYRATGLTADFPDFGGFSNGWAHQVTEGDGYKSYEYTGAAGDVMIPEYVKLLTESYGFVLTDTTTSSTESAEITNYSLSHPGAALELTLQDARSVQGGGGELKLSFTSGLEPVTGEEKTSYIFRDNYTLQDFAAFAGKLAGTLEESENEYGHKFNYPLSSDEAVEAANQYIALIKSCAYPYYVKQAGTYTGGSTDDFIGLEEFGPNTDLPHFAMIDHANNTTYTESIAVYVSMDSWQDGSKELYIVVSPAIALVDDGYRASV